MKERSLLGWPFWILSKGIASRYGDLENSPCSNSSVVPTSERYPVETHSLEAQPYAALSVGPRQKCCSQNTEE